MDFEKSSLYDAVLDVVKDISKPVHFNFKVDIHVNNITIPALKLVSLDVIRDFELKYTDEIILTFLISPGTFFKQIFPYRNDIEITIIKIPVTEMGDGNWTEEQPESERFVAVLINQGTPLIEGDGDNIPSEEAINLTTISTVSVQLINKTISKINMATTGGAFRSSTPADCIKSILTLESSKINLPKEFLPTGVDIMPANSRKNKDHVIIPHGKLLVSVPAYIQEKYGVYSTGLGFYYLNNLWYVYSLYDTTRFDNEKDTITIINVPGKKFSGAERSYVVRGSNLIIIATGDTSFADKSDYDQLNLGNGVRFTDATSVMDNFVKTVDNKAIVSRGARNTEVMNVERESGMNNVRTSSKRITANPHSEYSELARRDGAVVNMVWENANSSLIRPAMSVRILYLEKEEIKTIYGVLLKSQIFTHPNGKVMFTNKYVTNMAISIFIDRKNIEK